MTEVSHKIYKIKPGDTLKKIADQLNLSVAQIRKYHNQRCELDQLLSDEIRTKNEYILIPLVEVIADEDTSKNDYPVVTNPDGSISMRLNQDKRSFTYTLNFTQDGELYILDYTMDVTMLKSIGDGFLFELDRRKPVYINREVSIDQIDNLSIITSETLYPLQLVVNAKGEVTEIYNYKEIQKRLNSTVIKIYREFEGDFINEYVDMLKDNMSDEAWITQNVKNDLFIKNYFTSLYNRPADEHGVSKWVEPYPVVMDEIVDYEMIQRLIHVTDEYNYIEISRHGEVIPDPNFNIMDGIPPMSGSFNANYYLNPRTYQIERLDVQYTFKQEQSLDVSLDIMNIEPMKIPKKEISLETVKFDYDSEEMNETDILN